MTFDKLEETVKEQIEIQAEIKAKAMPIVVHFKGEEISLDDQWIENGEIHVSIENPIFFAKTGKVGFVSVETPKRMAIFWK